MTEQLSNPPYQGGYDVGTSVGMALPSGWQTGEGINNSINMEPNWTKLCDKL
jgi:hypothetical protein